MLPRRGNLTGLGFLGFDGRLAAALENRLVLVSLRRIVEHGKREVDLRHEALRTTLFVVDTDRREPIGMQLAREREVRAADVLGRRIHREPEQREVIDILVEQRNLRTPLDLIEMRRPARAQEFPRRRVRQLLLGHLRQLSELLLERHSREQPLDARIDAGLLSVRDSCQQ